MPEFEVPKSMAQKSSIGDGGLGAGERVMAGRPVDRRIA
jgi:hypothetical protein